MLNNYDLIDAMRDHLDTLMLGNEVIDRTDTLINATLDMFEKPTVCFDFQEHRLKSSADISQLYSLLKLAHDLIAETTYTNEVIEAIKHIDDIKKEYSEVNS